MNYRDLPSVHDLLDSDAFAELMGKYSRDAVRAGLREIIAMLRDRISTAQSDDIIPENLARSVEDHLENRFRRSLQSVINATGTVLHTNLGRAPLSSDAAQAVVDIATGYCNLEFDLETGIRGHRADHVSHLLTRLTGAEAAFAVNNNAGAVLLCLSALARDKEVIVSRGELIEIGGGFRIPDVMAASGAILKEVGTTNRTHLHDFQSAVTDNTGMFFKAHFSNFAMTGFTREVELDELISLGNSLNIPVMYDLGSGCFFDGSSFGWFSTPVIQTIKSGADLVTFSGDKLLGGPQSGLIIGKKSLIDTISTHPLARALRLDKMTLAALETTLQHYIDPERDACRIPTIAMLTMDDQTLKQRTARLLRKLKPVVPKGMNIQIAQDNSAIGGGALPLVELPTWVLEIDCESISVEQIREMLRDGTPPLICRIKKDKLLLDMRTIDPDEFKIIQNIFRDLNIK